LNLETFGRGGFQLFLQFILSEKNQFEDTLKIAGILISDKEDLIQKTVGCMLREVGKKAIEIEEKNF